MFIRDAAWDTACSLWFNELWSNQGQTIPLIMPRLPQCSKIWRMILGRMHALKCKYKKISCKSLKKPDWSYGNERKTFSTNHIQFIWLELWIKEDNGVHKLTINLTSHHIGRVTIHFVCKAVAYEIEDAYCRMIRTASCRMNHTLVRDDAGRKKLNQISGSIFLFFFVTNPTCLHERK